MKYLKPLLIALFAIAVIHPSHCQDFKELNVELIGQKTKNWCWAACMEMIIKFHEPASSITQCEIAKESTFFRNGSTDSEMCCTLDCEAHLEGTLNDVKCPTRFRPLDCNCKHNNTIRFTREGNNVQIGLFDLLFSSQGYISMESVNWSTNRMQWNEIKEQIDECRPFIIIFNPDSGSSNTDSPAADHAVVAKGYKEEYVGNDTIKYIITNDPWIPCLGRDYYLPYNTFEIPQTVLGFNQNYLINAVHATVNTIHPQGIYPEVDNQESCESVRLARPSGEPYIKTSPTGSFIYSSTENFSSDLIASTDPSFGIYPSKGMGGNETDFSSIIEENRNNIVGYQDNILSEDSYNEKYGRDSLYIPTRIEYVSSYNLLKDGSTKLEDVLFPNQIIETTYKGAEADIISVFQRIDDDWVLRGITSQSFALRSIPLTINREKIILSNEVSTNNENNPNVEETYINFSLVRYPDYLYEFYRFEYDDVKYLSPVADFPALKKYEKQVYKEESVVKAMKNRTSRCRKSEIDNIREYTKELLKRIRGRLD